MRLAVLADIHGNILALEAVLRDLERRGGADLTVNLGDCVSGPLWPRETVELLMAQCWPTVRGNHDRRVASLPRGEMKPSDGFAHDRLTDAQRDWLGALPLTIELAPSVLAFHARPDHDERYLAEIVADGHLVRAPLARIEEQLAGVDPASRLLLFGHSHRPDLIQLSNGRILFNPGSVGIPAYRVSAPPAHVSQQGSPHARYGLVELDQANAIAGIEMLAVPYDNKSAARRAFESGRPDLEHSLRTGFMPAAS